MMVTIPIHGFLSKLFRTEKLLKLTRIVMIGDLSDNFLINVKLFKSHISNGCSLKMIIKYCLHKKNKRFKAERNKKKHLLEI